jgi:rhamnulose-1-phosphate aldolase
MSKDILKSNFMLGAIELCTNSFNKGWNERNAGNFSYRLYDSDIKDYGLLKPLRTIDIDFDLSQINNQYFLVSGTGKYFKNAKNAPESVLGIIKVNNKQLDILWGFNNGRDNPTSEISSHLLMHLAKQQIDKNQRVVFHSHATNLTAMTFIYPLDEREFTRTLWQMESECIIVFPQGIGIVPWDVPGTVRLGKSTAEKVKEFNLVLWPHHGVLAVGNSFDDAYGLVECAEKAAEMWILAKSANNFKEFKNTITDSELKALIKDFKLSPNKKFL